MSLRWNVENVEDFEEVCYVEDEDGNTFVNPVTKALIFMSMAVGLGKIDEANVGEWVARIGTIESFDGPMVWDGEGEPVSLADTEIVRQHIGLTVNVHALTREEWLLSQVESRVEDVARTAQG